MGKEGGGRRKERKHMITPTGIKGARVLLAASGLQQDHPQAFGSIHWRIFPWPNGTAKLQVLNPHVPPRHPQLWSQLLVCAPKCESRLGNLNTLRKMDQGLWTRETQQTEATVPPSGKQTRGFLQPAGVIYENKKKYKGKNSTTRENKSGAGQSPINQGFPREVTPRNSTSSKITSKDTSNAKAAVQKYKEL